MKSCVTAILLTGVLAFAQSAKQSRTGPPENDYTGMYTFLRDGEFVRINVEDGTRLTGFISRHSDSGKAMFVDQFFETAEVHDHDLRFSTSKVNGFWFDFKGAISRGPGKTRNAEDYYEIKGTLTQHSSSQEVTSKALDVTLHSLPSEICD